MAKTIALLLALACMANATTLEPFELNYSNFNWYVADRKTGKMVSDKPWFVKFYAPWCAHCKHLEPIWQELHENNENDLYVGDVDCTSHEGAVLC